MVELIVDPLAAERAVEQEGFSKLGMDSRMTMMVKDAVIIMDTIIMP